MYIWKKQSPFLYDVLVTRALEWPTLTVQWLPETSQSDFFTTSSLLLGTHTSQNDHDFVEVAKVDIPKSDYNGTQGTILNKVDVIQKIDHEGEVNKARYSPKSPNVIATLSPSGDTLIFDRHRLPERSEDHISRPYLRLKHHTSEGWGLSWSPFDSGKLVTGSEDKTVAIWDISKSGEEGEGAIVKPIEVITTFDAIVNDVSWSPKLPTVFGVAGEDQSIRIFDTRSLRSSVFAFEECHKGAINGLDFNPFHEHIFATASSDGQVGIWDLRKGSQPLSKLEGHSSEVSGVEWSPHDSSVLASAGYDRRVNIWDLSLSEVELSSQELNEGPPELLFIHGGHTNKISDFSWHPELPWVIASASEDNVVQVWKVAGAIADKPLEEEEEQANEED
ncbi:Hat2p [Sugiyamaella lignohabitans]|uniref:Hat2p n=1 Tax=Sugiyamaella lignohabitans TaxID=796027 RepID=A0A161HKF0_9ASCO|nr:Hat2p [Sugiyamaella lignohabitans]ANB13457.1 Hat2p [Sugiyamaella lignohabitans]